MKSVQNLLSNHLWHSSLTLIHTVSASNSWTTENIFEEINIIFISQLNIIHFIPFHLSISGDIRFHKNMVLSQKTSSATAVLSFVFYYIRVNNYVILFSHWARPSKWVNSVSLFVCLIVSAWLREFVHLGMLHIAVSFFLVSFPWIRPCPTSSINQRRRTQIWNEWLTGCWINLRCNPPHPLNLPILSPLKTKKSQ